MDDATATPQPTKHPQPPPIQQPMGGITPFPSVVPDEAYDDLKAQALRESGSDEVRTVTVDGIEHEFVLRRPTKAEWDAYFDGAMDPSRAMQANRDLAGRCTLFPSRIAHLGSMQRDESLMPALPMRLCDLLETWVGFAAPRETVLTAAVDATVLASYGLTVTDAATLLAKYPAKGQVRLLGYRTTPKDWAADDANEVVVVVKSPDKGVYEGFIATYGGVKKAAAAYDFAIACVVMPEATLLPALLSAYPGVATKLADTLVVMGGAGARTSAKKR